MVEGGVGSNPGRVMKCGTFARQGRGRAREGGGRGGPGEGGGSWALRGEVSAPFAAGAPSM